MHRSQKLVTPILVLISIAASALAQNTPPQSAVDSDKRALLEELVSMVNGEQVARQMFDQLGPLVEQQFGRALDQLLPKTIDRTAAAADIQSFQKDLVTRIANGVLAQLKDLMMDVYGSSFTTAQLRELVAFYRTPTGQVLLKKMPEISQKGAAAGQQTVMQMLPELTKAMQDWSDMMKKKYGAQ